MSKNILLEFLKKKYSFIKNQIQPKISNWNSDAIEQWKQNIWEQKWQQIFHWNQNLKFKITNFLIWKMFMSTTNSNSMSIQSRANWCLLHQLFALLFGIFNLFQYFVLKFNDHQPMFDEIQLDKHQIKGRVNVTFFLFTFPLSLFN